MLLENRLTCHWCSLIYEGFLVEEKVIPQKGGKVKGLLKLVMELRVIISHVQIHAAIINLYM